MTIVRSLRTHGLVPRLQPLRSTIFAEMTALAVRTGAVNLGQGFPDTDGPAGMLEAARSAIASGHNQYPPGPGIPELRNAIAEQRAACYGLVHDPDTEVLVTVGATEAISAALLALVGQGDEVLLIEPYYDSYPAAVALAGATRRCVPLVADGDRFTLDVDALASAITPATKALLLNSPHNPTGTVLRRCELEALAALAVEHDLLVITDEVYEHLVFDGAPHLPIATFPGMAQRTLSVSSAGKTFSVTGWKIGWVCGPAHLVAAVRAVKQFLTFVGGAPLQPAVAHALRAEHGWVAEHRAALQGKQRRLAAGLHAAGFGVLRSEGTYFICADIRPLGYCDGVEFCRDLPTRTGVVAIPVQVFVDDPAQWRHLVRFAFCKRNKVLDEAIARLQPRR
ncbi:MAG: N-succinyldiaminopimelate aminotransferase [Pseudonocardiales bacterium]|jgi:N-succinyldiaminopimelate aminotransferase|nr:N-succinyldiaminopimelate aminotransferase [Pseudonocardiales bacterium]